ncbi:Prophage CP4-57 regulatory protein (AlpA) [Tepidimonas charontis]|uniref:Prophage CP4-57 regulatory protein (AlpA) n=1 Tax=Tepidimonas charontis TaxID=2267262 RepID=A0A554WYR6_9BURK|nr:Prophage CP4-57 regulatory protein (AlpA) [Tepidimonas charontis]
MRTIDEGELKIPGRVLINRKQLLKIVPLSDRTIFDMEKRGEFPKRFALTPRSVAWDLKEVEAWIEARKAAAQRPKAPGRLSPRGRSCQPSPEA